jgi:hypothetical protein
MTEYKFGDCMQQPCFSNKLKGYDVCHAHLVLIKCELKTCDEWVWKPYTTCRKHTRLLYQLGEQPVYLMTNDYGGLRIPVDNNDFRFSASYASRYNNCHGSANLAEAIPGFEHPARNDNGMKGEGTKLHEIFAVAISSGNDLEACAKLLEVVAALWGPKRVAFLKDEKKYIISWFMQHKSEPPIEMKVLADNLILNKEQLDTDGNGTGVFKEYSIAPRRILFVAEALRYVKGIIEDMDADTLELLVEVKAEAAWLTSKPKTTVDLIIRDKDRMHVLDLKMGDLEVSPIMNEQLMYYTETFILKADGTRYEDITLHIMQRGYTDEWILPATVHKAWTEKVKASEQAILDGDLTLSAGSHCKFCPANPHGRGDRGNKACPVMMTLLYGERDRQQADDEILEELDA